MYIKVMTYTQTDKNYYWIASGYRSRNDECCVIAGLTRNPLTNVPSLRL